MKSVIGGPVRGHVQVELLSAYLDQQASPAERAYVDAHLQQCLECRAELESLRRTVVLLHALPRVPVPRAFTLSEAQVGIRRPGAAPNWLGGLVRGLGAVAAIALVAFVALSILRPEQAPWNPSAQTVARVSPTSAPVAQNAVTQVVEKPGAAPAAQTEAAAPAPVALMVLALVVGAAAAWISGKKVKMTDMPQMVAIYNGMGGGAAAAIAAIAFARGEAHGTVATTLAVLGALIGSVSFTGSCVAYAKLQGLLKKAHRLPAQNAVNVVLALAAIVLGGTMIVTAPARPELIYAFFAIALLLGLIVTLPIGGADMPVVISLFNAFTGLAVGFEGYVQGNPALIIAKWPTM